MKTHAIEWSYVEKRDNRIARNPTRERPRSLQRSVPGALNLATRALLAVVVAAGLVVAAAWLVTLPAQVVYLQAALWAGGFVFVALAIESDSPLSALLLLTTGIAMPVLAWLSSRVAVELAIVAAALVAVWAVVAILRRTEPCSRSGPHFPN